MLSSLAAERIANDPALAALALGAAGALTARAWAPLPGPQTEALESAADVVGFGGQAGGGKTDLLLGMAALQHRQSIIFRREFPRVRAIIERSREIFALDLDHAADSYNEGTHLWRLADGRTIEFGHLQREESKKGYQGRAYDFHGFDEVTEFSEPQVRFVTAWNRSARPGQRSRVLMTFNPPMDDAGAWVLRYFAPWLDDTYTGVRALPGELRAFTTIAGKDQEVPLGTPGSKTRTFIPARLSDNPFLLDSGYADTIAALPEPLRSILLGDYNAARTDNPWQIIPTEWIALARSRWRPDMQAGPCSGVGLDVARGGQDSTVAARLYGAWLAPLQSAPGRDTPNGASAAALVLMDAAAGAPVGVDVIGVGASAYDSLAGAGLQAAAINFAAAARDPWTEQVYLDRTGKLRFINLRAYGYWLAREMLDPAGVDPLALPDDDMLATELRTPRWSLSARGVQVEAKDDIIARVGHSPDRADALVLALLAPLLALPIGTPGI